MRRILKWFALGVGSLAAGLVLVLAVTGLPAPPSIGAHDVPRIDWKWVGRMGAAVRDFDAGRSVGAWDPWGAGVWILDGLQRQVVYVDQPGGEAREVPLIGTAAGLYVPDSPDGRYLAFIRDQDGSERDRLYALDREADSTFVLTPEPARMIVLGFDAEGGRIAYASTARNGEDFDLYTVDVDGGRPPVMIYEADGELAPEAWSPDGTRLLVAELLSHTDERLHLLHLADGRLERLLPEWGDTVSFGWQPKWTPDGTAFYFTTTRGSGFERLHRYELSTGLVTALTPDLEWDVTDIALTPDGSRLALLVNEDGRPAVLEFEVATAALTRIPDAPAGHLGGYGLQLTMHPIRAEFAMQVIDALSFGSVHSYDMDAGAWRRWTSPPDRNRTAPDVELVRYPTFDSVDAAARTIPAFVFRPAGEADGSRPVAIAVHGGPAMQSFAFSTPIDRAIIAEGVILIQPNVRGSSGYGREYMSLDDRERREDAVRDIGALLDWIATQPDMDADRIGVYGGSYGGYMTLATLVNYSDRVRCGFDLFGISDLAGYVDSSREEHFPEAQRREFGDERDPVARAFLDSISPVNRAAEIRVPLLVFQGLNDVRVKPAESRRMVAAIREAGGHVRYIEAENEGHGFEHPLNLLYVAAAAMDFLAECLELD